MFPVMLGLAVAVGAPALKDPPKKDPPSIVGRWVGVSLAQDGVPRVGELLSLTFTADGKVEGRDEKAGLRVPGTYTLAPSKDPPEIDIMWPGADRPQRAIYKFDGEHLVICTSRAPDVRPTTFQPKAGAGSIVAVYKRAQKKD